MNVFAHGVGDIEVACDASLDEGDAIIRTRFEPSIGSSGTEYFVQVSPNEAVVVADYLAGWAGDEEIKDIVTRLRRLTDYFNSGNPGERPTKEAKVKTIMTYRFDVSKLSERELAHFQGHVEAQAEREKGEDGYPDVPIIGIKTTHEIDSETVRDEIYALISPSHPFESVDALDDETIRVALGGRAFLVRVDEVE